LKFFQKIFDEEIMNTVLLSSKKNIEEKLIKGEPNHKPIVAPDAKKWEILPPSMGTKNIMHHF
jgi:hypothetical protein